MEALRRADHSAAARHAVTGAIFLLMLALNLLTPYLCDDFSYRLNFLTREPLGGLWEIFPSMYAHSYKMNGRLISHGLAQLFMLLPSPVFDLCNAALFALSLRLAQRLWGGRSALELAGSFCLLWLALPAFGQVVLWQVGAINYFWSLSALLLFIAPELLRLREGRLLLPHRRHRVLFCIFAFFFGWYHEIPSFVGICMIPALVLLDVWCNGAPFHAGRLLPSLFAALGYGTMLAMPAQGANKSAGALTVPLLLERLKDCTGLLLRCCGPLLLLVALLLALHLLLGRPRRQALLAALFALAGICAGYMLVAASYSPQRCLCTTVLLLLMAAGFLWPDLSAGRGFGPTAGAVALLLALTLPAGLLGCRDIVRCFDQHRLREQTISAALSQGIRQVTANVVIPQTRWSGYWGLQDLSRDSPDTWPNGAMARYYGLDALLGEGEP